MKQPSRPALIALLLAPALAVGACSKDTASYPSLGIRPTESIGFGEPAGKPVVVQPDPTLDADIAAFRTQLDRIRAGFAKDAASTQAAARAARGGAVGSEPWQVVDDGAPRAIRTPDPQIRSLMLYPAELWVPGEALLAGPFGGCKTFSALPQILCVSSNVANAVASA